MRTLQSSPAVRFGRRVGAGVGRFGPDRRRRLWQGRVHGQLRRLPRSHREGRRPLQAVPDAGAVGPDAADQDERRCVSGAARLRRDRWREGGAGPWHARDADLGRHLSCPGDCAVARHVEQCSSVRAHADQSAGRLRVPAAGEVAPRGRRINPAPVARAVRRSVRRRAGFPRPTRRCANSRGRAGSGACRPRAGRRTTWGRCSPSVSKSMTFRSAFMPGATRPRSARP